MTKGVSYQQERKAYSLEEFLSDDIRYVIQRTVQEGSGAIREGHLRRNCISAPEFLIACEIAESSGLRVTL
jgi:hypothetical protein